MIVCTIITRITGKHIYRVSTWDEARAQFYAWYDSPRRHPADWLVDSY